MDPRLVGVSGEESGLNFSGHFRVWCGKHLANLANAGLAALGR
jgi:hypothetical protein